jgi:hypothetical protein
MHSGFDSESTRLVGAGNDAGTNATIGQCDRFGTPLWMIDLFNRCKEGIHVC